MTGHEKENEKKIYCHFVGPFDLLTGFNHSPECDRQNEKVDVINRYIAFQDDVEAIVYNNITLVNGYLAYIKADDTVTQEKTMVFLDYLIKDQAHFIRNIGIIEDTIIVWNYPLEANERSIGVNLANVPGQREAILNDV